MHIPAHFQVWYVFFATNNSFPEKVVLPLNFFFSFYVDECNEVVLIVSVEKCEYQFVYSDLCSLVREKILSNKLPETVFQNKLSSIFNLEKICDVNFYRQLEKDLVIRFASSKMNPLLEYNGNDIALYKDLIQPFVLYLIEKQLFFPFMESRKYWQIINFSFSSTIEDNSFSLMLQNRSFAIIEQFENRSIKFDGIFVSAIYCSLVSKIYIIVNSTSIYFSIAGISFSNEPINFDKQLNLFFYDISDVEKFLCTSYQMELIKIVQFCTKFFKLNNFNPFEAASMLAFSVYNKELYLYFEKSIRKILLYLKLFVQKNCGFEINAFQLNNVVYEGNGTSCILQQYNLTEYDSHDFYEFLGMTGNTIILDTRMIRKIVERCSFDTDSVGFPLYTYQSLYDKSIVINYKKLDIFSPMKFYGTPKFNTKYLNKFMRPTTTEIMLAYINSELIPVNNHFGFGWDSINVVDVKSIQEPFIYCVDWVFYPPPPYGAEINQVEIRASSQTWLNFISEVYCQLFEKFYNLRRSSKKIAYEVMWKHLNLPKINNVEKD